jgi:prevent-host-death family protein
MASIKPSQDVQPVSAFRANAASFIDQVRDTKRPLILTQHGKSSAVLMDVEEYEALIGEVELLRDVRQSRAEIAEGEGVSHAAVAQRLKDRLEG